MVRVSLLRTDGTQSRAAISQQCIDDYADAMAAGETFPPLDVFGPAEGGVYYVADGHQRLQAMRANRVQETLCLVHPGGQEEAVWFACGANARHGLRRTAGDLRRAVELALAHPASKGMKGADLAKHIGVSRSWFFENRKILADRAKESAGGLDCPSKPKLAAGTERGPDKPDKPAKKRGDSPPAESRMDANGRPLPDGLRDVFGDETLRQALDASDGLDDSLDALDDELQKLRANHADYPWLALTHVVKNVGQVRRVISEVSEMLASAIPHALCPTCAGEKCKDCRMSGYVPLWREKEILEQDGE